MPVLSTFFGIIVRMYKEMGGKHNIPHIHAEYSGEEIVVALDGTVLEGSFPKNKHRGVEPSQVFPGGRGPILRKTP